MRAFVTHGVILLLVLSTMIGCRPAEPLLEFREQVEVEDEGGSGTILVWVPATGVIDGEEVVLNSNHFKKNTYVEENPHGGGPMLCFEFTEEGSILCEQITSRLLDKPLAIFRGEGDDAEPLLDKEGQPIAPVVKAVITDKGVISGLSLADANELSRLINESP
ncbi:MAG TPA: hypothetical protein G4O18_09780 [Dehalococcoidia bacterium]|nr:hypothetical protein [Dehalococcoidia bacterium]